MLALSDEDLLAQKRLAAQQRLAGSTALPTTSTLLGAPAPAPTSLMETITPKLNVAPPPPTDAPLPTATTPQMTASTLTETDQPTKPTVAAPPAPQIAPPVAQPYGAAPLPVTQMDPGTRTFPGAPTLPPRPPVDAPPPDETGPITSFGPENDLRFEQINPLASTRLREGQADVDTARRALSGGPSLSDAALEQFRLLGEATGEQRTRGIRDIGQAAARLGRLNSGMVTTDLGNLEDVLRTRAEQARRGLAADVATGEAGNRRANLAALLGLEGQQFGQEAGQRSELRGERGYQADTAQTALDNRVRQRLLEEQLLNSAYGRELAGADLGLRGSELYSGDAAASGELTDQLLEELARAQAAKRTNSAGTQTSDARYRGGYG